MEFYTVYKMIVQFFVKLNEKWAGICKPIEEIQTIVFYKTVTENFKMLGIDLVPLLFINWKKILMIV